MVGGGESLLQNVTLGLRGEWILRKSHNLLITNKFFENVVKVQIFGNDSNKSNCIREEIKSRLK
jgi:hypothetical protein